MAQAFLSPVHPMCRPRSWCHIDVGWLLLGLFCTKRCFWKSWKIFSRLLALGEMAAILARPICREILDSDATLSEIRRRTPPMNDRPETLFRRGCCQVCGELLRQPHRLRGYCSRHCLMVRVDYEDSDNAEILHYQLTMVWRRRLSNAGGAAYGSGRAVADQLGITG